MRRAPGHVPRHLRSKTSTNHRILNIRSRGAALVVILSGAKRSRKIWTHNGTQPPLARVLQEFVVLRLRICLGSIRLGSEPALSLPNGTGFELGISRFPAPPGYGSRATNHGLSTTKNAESAARPPAATKSTHAEPVLSEVEWDAGNAEKIIGETPSNLGDLCGSARDQILSAPEVTSSWQRNVRRKTRF